MLSMTDNIIDFQREQAALAFQSEWKHQIAHAEGSLKLLEEHFLWTLIQLKERGETAPDSDDAIFFEAEIPVALEEARDALAILKKLCRGS